MVCGRVGKESIKKLTSIVKKFSLKENTAEITFVDGERAFIQIGTIDDVAVSLNGRKFSGPIVTARVSANGKKWFVLDKAGTIDSNE